MRKEIRLLARLQEEEERMSNYYQQEREKLNYNWVVVKKTEDDLKAQLINKEREIEDQFENHQVTKNLYQQKHL